MENESKTENESQAARLLEKHGDRVFRHCIHVFKELSGCGRCVADDI